MISKDEYLSIALLIVSVIIGLIWTIFHAYAVLSITVKSNITSSLLDSDTDTNE